MVMMGKGVGGVLFFELGWDRKGALVVDQE